MERSSTRLPASRLKAEARRLLNASTLCAIATVTESGRAHVNTAYFAWSPSYEIVWLSAPESRHSRNLATHRSAAIAVYDSTQTWGGPDRGIQVFGAAREAKGRAARDAKRLYVRRFPDAAGADLDPYRCYVLRPRQLKLFDERRLGGGVFVTARVGPGGRLAWVRTERYSG